MVSSARSLEARALLGAVATAFFTPVGCSSGGEPTDKSPSGDAGEAGAAGTMSRGGATSGGGTSSRGGASGSGGTSSGGGSGEAGSNGGGEGGNGSEDPDFGDVVERGAATTTTVPRPDFGAVLVAGDGARLYAVESRRDIEPGPFGLPWRSRFRLAAYDDGDEAWLFEAERDDVISDVVVHPSGDVTIAVLRHPPERMAYDLVRLDPNGDVLSTTTLAEPETLPDGDFGPSDPRPLFRMKSEFADATVGGWVRLLADGENLTLAFLSYVDVPSMDPLTTRLALGLEAMEWKEDGYAERWARVVDGLHAARPSAWAYDELRQRDQAVRPFLARDPSTGELIVGRAWNNLRCQANVATFAEFTAEDCLFGPVVRPEENERLPLAVTEFDSNGERLGTVILVPDADAAEQVPYALAARDGELVVAGMIVRTLEDGSKRTYPDPSGYVDYDGYIAAYDRDGALVQARDYNLGRGDVLAALRLAPDGVVAVGSAGWDRWQGGKSISRGAEPLVAWLSRDGSRSATSVIATNDTTRHHNLHDLALVDGTIVAHGFSDAPMTHSADNGNDAARTFGALRIELRPP